MRVETRIGLVRAISGSLAVWFAYSRTFHAPFLLDDIDSIQNNPALLSLRTALLQDASTGIVGRPLAAFTFYLNREWSGLDVWSYHLCNLGIHLASFLAFGSLLTALFRLPRFGESLRRNASSLAWCAASIWALHPVQTEAVTYLSQRTESLAACFYFLTLLGAVVSLDDRRRGIGWSLAILSCIAGALVKELIVTAPIAVWLLDRTVGGEQGALSKRWPLYIGLSGSWLVILVTHWNIQYLNIGDSYGVTRWNYALHSCYSVLLYLWRCVWPSTLVFDYGFGIQRDAAVVWPAFCAMVVLLASTVFGLARRTLWGLGLALFFGVLVPTTSFVPITGQPTAEHRIYFSSAVWVAFFIGALAVRSVRATTIAGACTGVVFCALTYLRNLDYATNERLWQDTMVKAPFNERALNNYAIAISEDPSRIHEALGYLDQALLIRPGYADVICNRGVLLMRLRGREEEAVRSIRHAIEIDAGNPIYWALLGQALSASPEKFSESVAAYRHALEIQPRLVAVWEELSLLLFRSHVHDAEAIEAHRKWIELDPKSVKARIALGSMLRKHPDRQGEVEGVYREGLAFVPRSPQLAFALGEFIMERETGKTEAKALFELCVAEEPMFADAHLNLGQLLAGEPGGMSAALAHFERALELQPHSHSAMFNTALALAQFPEKRMQSRDLFREIVTRFPDDRDAAGWYTRLSQTSNTPSDGPH